MYKIFNFNVGEEKLYRLSVESFERAGRNIDNVNRLQMNTANSAYEVLDMLTSVEKLNQPSAVESIKKCLKQAIMDI